MDYHATLKTQDPIAKKLFPKDRENVGLKEHDDKECSFVLFLVGK